MKFGRLPKKSVKKSVKNSDICHAVIVAALMALSPASALALGPQCVDLFHKAPRSAAEIRDLKEVDWKTFSQALRNVDDQALLKVFRDLNLRYQGSDRPQFIKESLATLAKDFERMMTEIADGKARGLTLSADRFAMKTAKVVMDEVFRFHNSGMKKSMNGSERQSVQEHFLTLQAVAEEAMIAGHLQRPGSRFFEIGRRGSLSPSEIESAGRIGELLVVPGDLTIQGSTAMSSTFILGSQNIPGVGSHNALISAINNGKPVVTEALIEDGVKQRLADVDSVQRYYVLSMRTPEQRAKVAEAIQKYNKENSIPFDSGEGAQSTLSPVAYDASMSWEMADKGLGVSCATLASKIYEKAGFTDGRGNPFTRAQGSRISGVSAELYDLMSVSGNKNAKNERSVPSPTDPLLASSMELRGYRANYESLIVGRQMRVTMDAIMNLLESESALKTQFFSGLEKIPNIPVDKARVLEMVSQLEKTAAQIKDPMSGRPLDTAKISSLRAQIEESLPLKANLRQIAIFASMNGILEPLVINKLGAYEKANGGFVSRPELSARAEELVRNALQVTSLVLNELPKVEK